MGLTKPAAGAVLLGAGLLAAGCVSFGGGKLEHDQVDYARSLDRAQKRQTLANIVSLRYADTPTFLPVTQVIAAYNFDASATASVAGSTINGSGTSGSAGGTVGYSNHPTFTFTPTTGEEFAAGYIRPLSPSLVLPLVQSGVPIDLLLRIVMQSVGDLQNSAALSGAGASSGSVGFFELIHVLRRLQLKGALTVRFEKTDDGNRVFLAIDPTRSSDQDVADDAQLARKLLHAPVGAKEIEVVYGAVPERGATVGVVTRSVTGVLTEIGAQIEVPEADVHSHATTPTVKLLDVESRPTIIVHVGQQAPPDAYASAVYGANQYWIDSRDFDSKFAFSVVQNLIALAETSGNSKAPIVTIPAN